MRIGSSRIQSIGLGPKANLKDPIIKCLGLDV